MRTKNKIALILASILAVIALSFSPKSNNTPAATIYTYYKQQLSLLNKATERLQRASSTNAHRDSLLQLLYASRKCYKTIEPFIDVYNPVLARKLNGPDLMKIDEEHPTDTLIQHGYQVLERMVTTEPLNKKEIQEELSYTINLIKTAVNDNNAGYFFTDFYIWHSLRTSAYKIVSMGITGFDVPITNMSLPECAVVLQTISKTKNFYKSPLGKTLSSKGDTLCLSAIGYLNKHNNFDKFDRLTFIRDYMNPISEWLRDCTIHLGLIDTISVFPLSQLAGGLFDKSIMNMKFFSPNSDYYPTTERVALGAKLFYDPILSGDGNRSCATCHKPELAFTDGLVTSPAMSTNKRLLRNTPTLWNAGLQTSQFYDSRARVLENQLSDVVHNSEEMNGSLRACIPALTTHKEYSKLFASAYASEPIPITEYTIANAVSSYIRSLVSFNSRFDQYMRRETNSLSEDEKKGFNLFMGKAKCGTCHYAPLFNGLTPPLYQETESETIGVTAIDSNNAVLDADAGKEKFTKHPFHKYSFKTPTVRNAALTAPYMHNGAFATLASVVSFYNDGGGAGRGANIPTQTLPADKLNLSKKEQAYIIAFIHSLTDTNYSKTGLLFK